MTDLETMKSMLTRAKIPFEEGLSQANVQVKTEQVGDSWVSHYERRVEVVLTVEGGYFGFCTDLTFSLDGSLKSVKAFG